MRTTLPKFVLTAILVGCALLYVLTVPGLPDVIASQFRGDGLAKSYMTRSFYLPYIVAFGIGLPLFLAFVISVLPAMLGSREKTPAMSETQARIVVPFGWWYAGFTALFAAASHILVIEANRADPPRLANGPFFVLFMGFMAVTLVWTGIVVMRARKAN